MLRLPLLSAALAATALALAAAPAAAQDLSFKLINQSSSPITGFYVSTVNTDQWEENLMPEGYVLAPGYEVDVQIADGETVCEYDILAEFEDGSSHDERGLDLCSLGEWTYSDQ